MVEISTKNSGEGGIKWKKQLFARNAENVAEKSFVFWKHLLQKTNDFAFQIQAKVNRRKMKSGKIL